MSIKGVIGVGEGLCNGDPCIKVFVSKIDEIIKKKIPSNIDGYDVKIEESTTFHSL